MTVRFFTDGITFNLKGKRQIVGWIEKIAEEEKKTIDSLCYVFISDKMILEMNRTYLKHDNYTDIITFDNSSGDVISGEMYISINTVKENAKYYKVSFRIELLRVILHGVLHLCGYKDDTEDLQKKMRKIEEKYLTYLTRK